MFSVINSSILNNCTTVQELSRTPENTQGQQNVFQGSRTQQVLVANSRKVLGAQGLLVTLSEDHTLRLAYDRCENRALMRKHEQK